jgi:hypothetical protein
MQRVPTRQALDEPEQRWDYTIARAAIYAARHNQGDTHRRR